MRKLQEGSDKKLAKSDQLTLGFLNGVIAIPTGVILWVALNGFPWANTPWLPAVSIVWFTIAAFIAGAVNNNNFLINFYGKVWHLLVKRFTKNG